MTVLRITCCAAADPQNDIQAMARSHRIGQKKQVTIYRLITKGTYEEAMFQKAGLKLGLEKAILHSWVKVRARVRFQFSMDTGTQYPSV